MREGCIGGGISGSFVELLVAGNGGFIPDDAMKTKLEFTYFVSSHRGRLNLPQL